jgi:phage baseplate assembly protein W
MSAIRFPFGIDGRGRTAAATPEERIRQLVEQVLFTSPGERVNRPTFGCDLGRMVFAPNSDIAASTTQLTIQGALMQWLSDVLLVQAVEVVNDDSTMRVTVQYVLRATQERRILQLVQGG